MPAAKTDPDDSGQIHGELVLNLACRVAASDQGRVGKREKSNCVANQKGECSEEKTFTSWRRSGVSTGLSHSEMRLKDTVKREFQTCGYDTEEEPCSMSGYQKPLANAPCNDCSKRDGLRRLLGPPTHVCRPCKETHDSDCFQLRSCTPCERSFFCELCPEVFLNSADLAEHSRTHINHPLFICERCSITFSSKAHFDRHLQEHELRQLHNCHKCHEEFDDKLNLRVHIDVNIRDSPRCGSGHGPVAGEVSPYSCFALQDGPDVRHGEDLSTAHRTCHICAQTFDNETGLGEHVRTEHSAELPISSSQDKKPLLSQSFLDTAATSTQAGELVYESPSSTNCSFPESFESKADLEDLVRTRLHRDTQVQKAEPWPHSSTVETASSAEDQVPRSCHLCPEEFDDDDGLRRHIRTKHGSNKKRLSRKNTRAGKRFACEQCSKRFQCSGHLKRHMVTHTGETRFHCHLCPAKFSQNSDLKRHVHRHVGYKQFHCPLCPMQFVVKADMEVHRRTHTGERPFACDRCPASFSARDTLKKHVNSHEGVRPYACQKCPRTFTRLPDLRRHGRRHTGERPFSCDSCSKTFTRGHLLRDHVVAAHPSSTNRLCAPQ